MKGFKNNISTFLTLCMVFSLLLPLRANAASNDSGQPRLSGKDRYETSSEVSKKGWTNGSEYVVIASGEDFPDALCAVPLAKKYNAPVLLSERGELNQSIENELKRLGVKKVIIVGGPGAVSESVAQEISQIIGNSSVSRIWGKDRFETSEKVAREIGNFSNLILVNGNNSTDALSVAPVAGAKIIPILLTEKDSIPDIINNLITENKSKITSSYVIGGEGVVNDTVLGNLPQSKRIWGKDRYETNLNVIKAFAGSFEMSNVYVTTAGNGENDFADALSCAALAAKTLSPMLITDGKISDNARSFISENFKPSMAIVPVGGQAVLPSTTIDDIVSALPKDTKPTTPTTPTTPTKPTTPTTPTTPGNKEDSQTKNVSVKTNKNSVTIYYQDSFKADAGCNVTIVLLSDNSVIYIDQTKLVNSNCTFNTTLDSGIYNGWINTNSDKTIITNFTIE